MDWLSYSLILNDQRWSSRSWRRSTEVFSAYRRLTSDEIRRQDRIETFEEDTASWITGLDTGLAAVIDG